MGGHRRTGKLDCVCVCVCVCHCVCPKLCVRLSGCVVVRLGWKVDRRAGAGMCRGVRAGVWASTVWVRLGLLGNDGARPKPLLAPCVAARGARSETLAGLANSPPTPSMPWQTAHASSFRQVSA